MKKRHSRKKDKEVIPVRITIPLIPRFTFSEEGEPQYESFTSGPVNPDEINERPFSSDRGRKYGTGRILPSHIKGRVDMLVEKGLTKHSGKADVHDENGAFSKVWEEVRGKETYKDYEDPEYENYKSPEVIKKIYYQANERLKPYYEEIGESSFEIEKEKVQMIDHPETIYYDIYFYDIEFLCSCGKIKGDKALKGHVSEIKKLLKRPEIKPGHKKILERVLTRFYASKRRG